MTKTNIILGPPGCGKTTTLLERVDAELAAGTPPDRIGYLSFTRRAADEAVKRACEKFNLERKQLPWFRTIHSLCFAALGLRKDDVLNGVKLTRDFAEFARVKITCKWSDDGTLNGFEPGDRALFIDNLARVNMVPLMTMYDGYDEDPGVSRAELQRVSTHLAKFKHEMGYLDFTDMLDQFVKHQIDIGLDVLFVDEAQDLSRLQWKVIEWIARRCRKLIVAGDDDQAIYRWAGADVDSFIAYPGESEVLGQSWRVPRSVQRIAEDLIRRVKNRRPKSWAPRDEEGEVDRKAVFADLDLVGPDVLILVRNNFVIEGLAQDLRNRGILFKVNDQPSVAGSVARAIYAWEKLRRGERVSIDDARKVYEKMRSVHEVARGSKKLSDFDDDAMVSLDDLRDRGGLLVDSPWYDALPNIGARDVSYVRKALQAGEKLNEPPRVRLQTIHTSKGGEGDHVVLMLETARRTDREAERKPDDELRTWYVAATRARRRLTLVSSPTQLRCKWL